MKIETSIKFLLVMSIANSIGILANSLTLLIK